LQGGSYRDIEGGFAIFPACYGLMITFVCTCTFILITTSLTGWTVDSTGTGSNGGGESNQGMCMCLFELECNWKH